MNEFPAPPRFENTVPEIKELLGCMEQDVLFRHEVLVFFYKYKNKKPDLQEKEVEPRVVQK